MFTIQIVAQQGLNFAGFLFKDNKQVGGISNDSSDLFVNLKEKLTIMEMEKLMTFIKSLNSHFAHCMINISYTSDLDCPKCKKKIEIRNGHGRCECGAHVKFLND